MARCERCQAKLGWLFVKPNLRVENRLHCLSCGQAVLRERKQRLAEELLREPALRVGFMIPRLRTRDPDRPRANSLLLGTAMFTSKGVCFLQYALHKPPDGGAEAIFGFLGAAIAEVVAARRRKKEHVQGEEHLLMCENLTEMLERSTQVLLYRPGEISRLRIVGGKLEIRVGRVSKMFGLDGGRRECRKFKPLVADYSSAMRNGTDPTLNLPRKIGEPEANSLLSVIIAKAPLTS